MTSLEYLTNAQKILEAFCRMANHRATLYQLTSPLLCVSTFPDENKVVLLVRYLTVWQWNTVIMSDDIFPPLSEICSLIVNHLIHDPYHLVCTCTNQVLSRISPPPPQFEPVLIQVLLWLHSLQSPDAISLYQLEFLADL